MKDTESEELDLTITPEERAQIELAKWNTPRQGVREKRQPDYYDGDTIEPLDDLPDY
jgi:hypothetical protein